jgi:hypothetical protein
MTTDRGELANVTSSSVKIVIEITSGDERTPKCVTYRYGDVRCPTSANRDLGTVDRFRNEGTTAGPIDVFHLLATDHDETCP